MRQKYSIPYDRALTALFVVDMLDLFFSAYLEKSIWLHIPDLLALIGASGMVKELATDYLTIIIPSMPVLAMAMCFGAGLRAVCDAKRSMTSTLAGGAVNAVLDPVFISLLDMGIEGAAVASVFARITIFAVSAYGVKYPAIWNRIFLSY